MKYSLLPAVLAAVAVFQKAPAQTFGTDRHTITVHVSPITVVKVVGGPVNLSLTNASFVAGQDQMTITDQTTGLAWGTNSSARKISVSTNLATPRFTLKIVALNPTRGTAAPEVTLGTVANDLLLDIGRTSGTCTLMYTGIALASEGAGTDTHTITFTVQTQ